MPTYYYLFLEDGSIEKKPSSWCDQLHWGRKKEPRFANKSVRYLSVHYTTENRRPNEIRRLEAAFLPFGADGELNRMELALQGSALVEGYRARKALDGKERVVDAQAIFAARRVLATTRWTPTDEDIGYAIDDIMKRAKPTGSRR